MAELTREQLSEHRRALATIARRGLERDVPRERLSAVADRYLEQHGLTREQVLGGAETPSGGGVAASATAAETPNGGGVAASATAAGEGGGGLYIDPTTARVAGGMVAAGLGMAGPQAALPEELITVPLAGGVAGEAAKLWNWLMGAGPPPTVESAAEEIVYDAAGGTLALTMKPAAQMVGRAAREVVRTPARALRSTQGPDLLRVFADLGIPIKGQAGALTGNKATQGIEWALRKLPTSAAMYDEADDAVNAAFGRAGDRIARRLSPAREPGVVGRGVQRGLNTFSQTGRDKGKRIFGLVQRMVGPERPVQAQRTAQYVDELMAPYMDVVDGKRVLSPTSKTGVPPVVRQIAEEIEKNGGVVPWQRIEAWRRMIGDKIAEPMMGEATPVGQLRKLYAVVSDDMGTAASEVGEEAFRTWRRANQYWEALSERIDLVRHLANEPNVDNVFSMAFAGEKNGATLLRALKRSMGDENLWNDLVATKVRQMVDATAGQQNAVGTVSSPGSFLTRWNNMRPPVKDTLFGAQTPLRRSMDDLARAAEALKDTAKERNTSNTAAASFFMNLVSQVGTTAGLAAGGAAAGVYSGGGDDWLSTQTLLAGAGGAAGFLVAPRVLAKAMMNPEFVRWLARGAEITMKTNAGAQAFGMHLSRLVAIEANAQDAVPEITQMRHLFEQYLERDRAMQMLSDPVEAESPAQPPAAAGRSTLGIPQAVGQEYVGAAAQDEPRYTGRDLRRLAGR